MVLIHSIFNMVRNLLYLLDKGSMLTAANGKKATLPQSNGATISMNNQFSLQWHLYKKVVTAILFILILIPFDVCAAGIEEASSKEVLIGVLAKRGAEHTMKKWGPTADYLTRQVPGYSFKIQPLDFRSIFPAVEQRHVDFVLANSSFYVELEALYGIQRITTLRNRVGNAVSTVFGGVIFVRADNEKLKVLEDLRGKSFMGVDEKSLGGFRMAWGELEKNGINLYEDMSRLAFGGTHDAVVYAVRDGKVDAGTVRTDTLERMVDEDKINLDNFRVINHYPRETGFHFQFLRSTSLYPEWPFASLSSTSVELTRAVAVALLNMPPESPAALSSNGAGWDVPHNYQSVNNLLKGLRVGIYQDFGKVTFQDVLRLYWYWFLLGLLALMTMAAATTYVLRLNANLRRSRLALQEARDNLDVRVRERTHELEQISRDKQLLLDSAGEGIYGLDSKGQIKFINQCAIEMLGWDEQELMHGDMHKMTHHSRSDGTPYPHEECPVHAALRWHKSSHTTDELFWRKDNTSFPVEYTSTPILEDNGGVAGAVVIFKDITEREQTEHALRRSQKMDAIGQLTGGIAHDFNNILGIILGNLSFLERMVAGDEKALKRVKSANKAAQRAADLTKQLLGFSRQHAHEILPTNINLVIQSMDSLISRSITPEVEVENNLVKDLWLTEIDPGDFEDALLNIILNARDAMPEGGRLTIETFNKVLDDAYAERNPTVVPGKYTEITVSDTGSGISKEKLGRIFEPFYTTKPQGKGTGLGLSMVYGFINRSKGHIKVYSEPGIGTTIRCYLPRSSSTSEGQSLPVGRKDKLPRGNELILVVDDEEELIEVARHYLEELGYTVETATSGPQALEVLAEKPSIDLLFSDIVMPGGMSGYELAEQAEINHPEIKVLLTSGYTAKAVAHNGQSRFATNLLSKPFTHVELARRVRTMLGDTESDKTV